MNEQAFKDAYQQSRNGCNYFLGHMLARTMGFKFHYSDGVEQCADAGCYWLLDILATECPAVMRKAQETNCFVNVTVADSKADIVLSAHDDVPPLWTRYVPWTDLPTGMWVFELVDEGDRFALILLSEH